MRLPFIVIALLSLGAVITIHELGHFTFCKFWGVKTPVFSIGFGPSLVKKKIGETTFIIAAIPFGGYVQIAGLDRTDRKNQNIAGNFYYQPFYKKALILLGGIIFNLLAAYLIFLALLCHTIYRTYGFSTALILPALSKTLAIFLATIKQTVTGFLALPRDSSQIVGPVGLISFLAENVHSGVEAFFTTIAFMNVSVALFNILPLPILDGGKFVLISIETVLGRTISPVLVGYLNLISLLLILLLMVYMSFQDARRQR